jgi:hypothetical protein
MKCSRCQHDNPAGKASLFPDPAYTFKHALTHEVV